ncbi:MAG: MazG nucleotide pyrophosphohydrolase domain-containing protein [Gammaproteobacteria bacterium]|jgi:ATP diphosphatase
MPEPGLLEEVPLEDDPLEVAWRLQARAATVGFDWPECGPVFDKIVEEIAELRDEVEAGDSREHMLAELGDLLFAVVNLARHLNLDPEQALQRTNQKFVSRFACMESLAAQAGQVFADLSLDEQEALWRAAKLQLSK